MLNILENQILYKNSLKIQEIKNERRSSTIQIVIQRYYTKARKNQGKLHRLMKPWKKRSLKTKNKPEKLQKQNLNKSKYKLGDKKEYKRAEKLATSKQNA